MTQTKYCHHQLIRGCDTPSGARLSTLLNGPVKISFDIETFDLVVWQ